MDKEDNILDQESVAGETNPLEDLFNDAMLARAAKNEKRPRVADPSVRQSLDAAAKKMRELYTLPENWERTRGVALIDKASNVLVGNFSEYRHRSVPNTKKWLREHAPMAVDATEVVEGYLGSDLSFRLGDKAKWTEVHSATVDLIFPEMQVESPAVSIQVYVRLGALLRVDLAAETQFASTSGNIVLRLPPGTDILDQLGPDSRHAVRKAVGL